VDTIIKEVTLSFETSAAICQEYSLKEKMHQTIVAVKRLNVYF